MQKRTFVPGTGTNFMPREFSHGSARLGSNEGGLSASLEESSATLSGSDPEEPHLRRNGGGSSACKPVESTRSNAPASLPTRKTWDTEHSWRSRSSATAF